MFNIYIYKYFEGGGGAGLKKYFICNICSWGPLFHNHFTLCGASVLGMLAKFAIIVGFVGSDLKST